MGGRSRTASTAQWLVDGSVPSRGRQAWAWARRSVAGIGLPVSPEADSRMYRVGVRWNVGPQAWFSLDGNRVETSAGSAPTDTMMLRAEVRF